VEHKLSRREMLRLAGTLTVGATLAACGAAPTATPAPTPVPAKPVVQPTATPQPAAPVSITWLGWWVGSWGAAELKKLNDGFMAKNPNIKLTMEDVTYQDYLAKLTTAALAGQGWDCYGIESSWMVSTETWGFAENLAPWLAKSPDFVNRIVPTCKVPWKGGLYMLYLYLIPFNGNYRHDIFQQMGLKAPTNWEEFLTVLKDYKKTTGKYGFSYSLKSNSTQFIGKMWNYRLCQAGGRVVDDNSQVVFNSDAGVIASDWWKKFYQADVALPGSETEDKTTTAENLATGKIVMTIDGPYERSNDQQIVPGVDVWWCPAWRAETGGYNWGGSGIGMWKNGKNKEAAWKFIDYFYTDEVMVPLSKAVQAPFATKGVFTQDYSKDPVLHALPAMQNQDPAHNWSSAVIPEGARLYQLLHEAVLGYMKGERKDIKTELNTVAAEFQKTLDKYTKGT
jgi:ABC-type glycerol-3-phosphate transport system substrate-binding protein